MHPRMVMHPIRPELNGQDLTANKDPNGKQLFVEFVRTVQASGAGFVPYLWPKAGSDTPVEKRRMSKDLRLGAGSLARASTSTPSTPPSGNVREGLAPWPWCWALCCW